MLTGRIVTAAAPSTPTDPSSWLDSLGPYVAFGGLAVYSLVMLWRFIATLRADHAAEKAAMQEAHAAELAAKDLQIEDYKARERAQSDKAVAQAERTLPVIEAATAMIALATERLDRDR